MNRKRKYKEISHSHYELELENSGGKSWEEILSKCGKELDSAKPKIKLENVSKITIEGGSILIETIKIGSVNLEAPSGKMIDWEN